jgi:hypothetical protein
MDIDSKSHGFAAAPVSINFGLFPFLMEQPRLISGSVGLSASTTAHNAAGKRRSCSVKRALPHMLVRGSRINPQRRLSAIAHSNSGTMHALESRMRARGKNSGRQWSPEAGGPEAGGTGADRNRCLNFDALTAGLRATESARSPP